MSAETVSIWVTLAPVIVGGAIGLAGGLVGPPLSHWLNEKANRKKKRAEKLEELICILYEHRHWLDIVESIRVFGRDEPKPPTPLPKAIAIAAIDFPQFSEIISELEGVSKTYERWMLDAAKKRLAGEANYTDGINLVYDPYLSKLLKVVRVMTEYAKTELTK